jgi:hypothetical protein
MKLRSLIAGAALLVGAVPVVLVSPEPACAAGGPHAALVVDTGKADGRYALCVALGSDHVSGIQLIELAGEQYGLEYRLGYGGKAVCELAGVGTSGDDCFSEYPDFWGYWHGDGSGGWSWAGSGAASSSVGDGDVEGWSWGRGGDGSTHPAPPETTFRSVCGYAPPAAGDGPGPSHPSPHPTTQRNGHTRGPDGTGGDKASPKEPRSTPAPEASPSPVASVPVVTAATPSARARGHKKRGHKKKGRGSPRNTRPATRAGGRANPGPSPSTRIDALPASARSSDGGVPAAGLGAIALALAVLAGATVITRRRSHAG